MTLPNFSNKDSELEFNELKNSFIGLEDFYYLGYALCQLDFD